VTMSMVLAAALLQAPLVEPPAQADTLDPVSRQQDRIRRIIRPDCAAPATEDEIVVCGTSQEERDREYRAMVSWDETHARSQAGSGQMSALNAGPGTCSNVGIAHGCGGGLDGLAIGGAIIRGLRGLLERD